MTAAEGQRPTRGSGFFKELDGLPPSLQNSSVWLDFFTHSLMNNQFYQTAILELYRLHHQPDAQDVISSVQCILYYFARGYTINNNIDDLIECDYDSLINEPSRSIMVRYIHIISELLMIVEGLLMDGYAIGRMLKRPVGGAPSMLSLLYAGDAHVASMISILTNPLFGYQIADEVKATRCLTIARSIPLYTDIVDHAQRMNRSKNLEIYHNTLRREESGRANTKKAKSLSKNVPPNNGNEKMNVVINSGNGKGNRNTKKRQLSTSVSFAPPASFSARPSVSASPASPAFPASPFGAQPYVQIKPPLLRPSLMFVKPAQKAAPKKGGARSRRKRRI